MENENVVKRLCELFEPGRNVNNSRTKTDAYSTKNEEKEKTKIVMRGTKVQKSFLDVKNAQELRELKNNLTCLMDEELAKMKEDKYIYGNGNVMEPKENIDTKENVLEAVHEENIEHSTKIAGKLTEANHVETVTASLDTLSNVNKKQQHVIEQSHENNRIGKNDFVSYINFSFCPDNESSLINQGNGGTNSICLAMMEKEAESEKVVGLQYSLSPEQRLEYIREELLSTEQKYVETLARIVEIYKPYVEDNAPSYLKYFTKHLFGNIDEIYSGQLRFLVSLENCEEDMDQLIESFIDHEILFKHYPLYFINGPKSERVIPQFKKIIQVLQEYYDDCVDFSAYLLAPLTRFSKYILFMEDILNQYERLNLSTKQVELVINILKTEMNKGNDGVAIASIQGSPLSSMNHGSLILSGTLLFKASRKDIMVFLFEKVIIFTLINPEDSKTFLYIDSIMTNDLRMETKNCTIHLIDYEKSKREYDSSRHVYVLEAKTESVFKTWTTTIKKLLWKQLADLKEKSPAQIVSKESNMFTFSERNAFASKREKDQSQSPNLSNEHHDGKSEFQNDEFIENNFEKEIFGLLIKKGVFTLLEPVRSNAMVFLFENVVIIAKENVEESNDYQYYCSIRIIDLYTQALEENKIILKDMSSTQMVNFTTASYVLKTTDKNLWNEWKYTFENVIYDRIYFKNIQEIFKNTNELSKTVNKVSDHFENIELNRKNTSLTSPSDSPPPIPMRTVSSVDRSRSFNEKLPSSTENKLELPSPSENTIVDIKKGEGDISTIPPPLPSRNRRSTIQTKYLPPLPPRNRVNRRNIEPTFKESIDNHLDSFYVDIDLNAVKFIENSSIDPNTYGPFLMKEVFNITKPIKLKSTVFLFKNVIVFTRINSLNKTELEQKYEYIAGIEIKDLSIKSLDNNTFSLIDFTKAKANNDSINNTFQLKTEKTEIVNMWRESIEGLLWKQFAQMKANMKLPSLVSNFEQTRSSSIKSSQPSTTDIKVLKSLATNKTVESESKLLKSIKYSTMSKKEYGAFIMKNKFQVIEPTNFTSMVFLFENVVLITVVDLNNIDSFYFFGGIKIKKLILSTLKNSFIILKEFTLKKNRKQEEEIEKYILEAPTTDVWNTWTKTIQKMLPRKA